MSEANFDTTTSQTVSDDIDAIAKRLAEKLKIQEWKKIRVVFTGHAILGAMAKYLSYRICHLETTDIIYFGASGYHEYNYQLRSSLVK